MSFPTYCLARVRFVSSFSLLIVWVLKLLLRYVFLSIITSLLVISFATGVEHCLCVGEQMVSHGFVVCVGMLRMLLVGGVSI